MKKIFLALLLLAFTLPTLAQETVGLLPLELGKKTKKWEAHTIEQKDQDALFLYSKDSTIGISLTNGTEPQVRFRTRRFPVEPFTEIVAKWSHSEGYNILHSNESEDEFILTRFNKELELIGNSLLLKEEFKRRKLIESLVYNDKLYLLTTPKRSHELTMYVLDEEGNLKSKQFFIQPFLINGKLVKLSTLLSTSMYDRPSLYQAGDFPNYRKFATSNMIVVEDEKLYLIIDEYEEETEVIRINLDTNELIKSRFPKPFDDELKGFLASYGASSFVKDGKLFQARFSRKGMVFKITDMKSKKVLKQATYLTDESENKLYHRLKFDDEKFDLSRADKKVDQPEYDRYLKKTLKILANNSSSLIVNEYPEGQYHITMGKAVSNGANYYQYQFHMPPPPVYHPTPTFGPAPGEAEMTYVYGYAVTDVFLKFILDKEELQVKEGTVTFADEAWDEYLEKKHSKNKAHNLIKLVSKDEKGHAIYVLYDEAFNEYKFIKMESTAESPQKTESPVLGKQDEE